MSPSYLYYRLFDKNGRVVSLNSHYPSAPADGYTGQIDLNQVAPPNSVADIEKAITDQEGCKDAFISADWQLFPSPTSATPLSDTSTLSPGVGSKQTKYLVLRTTADILQERAASGATQDQSQGQGQNGGQSQSQSGGEDTDSHRRTHRVYSHDRWGRRIYIGKYHTRD